MTIEFEEFNLDNILLLNGRVTVDSERVLLSFVHRLIGDEYHKAQCLLADEFFDTNSDKLELTINRTGRVFILRRNKC